jgi:hypothetical protein
MSTQNYEFKPSVYSLNLVQTQLHQPDCIHRTLGDRYITNVCTKALYIGAYDILNILSLPSLDTEHRVPLLPEGKNASISSYVIGSAFTLLESF